MVDCAMYDFDAQLTTIIPGQTPCLACLIPHPPDQWRREFPVFGAVAGTIGAMGAVEAIKVITGIGQPLAGRLLLANLRDMTFRTMNLKPNPQCSVCAGV
jgi:molybdopterin/thiamine biosynthesis adenylyltransferase